MRHGELRPAARNRVFPQSAGHIAFRARLALLADLAWLRARYRGGLRGVAAAPARPADPTARDHPRAVPAPHPDEPIPLHRPRLSVLPRVPRRPAVRMGGDL